VADYQWREKVRNIQNSTKEESQVPERAKTLGFGCFTLGMILMSLFLGFFAYGLFSQGQWIFGAVSTLIVVGIGFMIFQLIKADKLT
jgi:hypothetical protein